MSKKSRRARAPNLPPEAFNAPAASAAPAAKPAAGNKNAQPAAPVKAASVNWKAEYGAVIGDLRRTAILATIMLAVMVVLSFIIP
jgi:hypothetical protein